MVGQGVPRHERVDARVWDQKYQRWSSLLPWRGLVLPYTSDWAVNKGTVTLPGDHPRAADLARVRAGIPLPVRVEVNGVIWDGQITSADYQSNDGAPVWSCEIDSDHKHGHRMLSRDTAVSAADMTATRLQGWLGDVTHRLVASNAQRTGLPVYVLIEGDGDPIDVEARTEDNIYDVLHDPLVGSRMHLDVRMLLPEDEIPGEGEVYHYAGQMERAWEQAELDRGEWPHAKTHERIKGVTAPHPQLLLPQHSWRGQGVIDLYGTELLYPEPGICWVPFETIVEVSPDYYSSREPEGVRVATEAELRYLQDNFFPGWSRHVTMWENWQTAGDLHLLPGAVEEGLVARTDGTVFESVDAIYDYLDGDDDVYTWRDGPTWVLSNADDFNAEHEQRQARGAEQRQTPGLLVHLHEERDRRGVVFSTTSGGGLEAWSVKHTIPDAAMVVMGAQIDQRTLESIKAGLTPPSSLGSYTPEEAEGVLPSGSVVPGTIDRLDVDTQPLASIDGTEVSYSSAGGKVDLSVAGPFFYREKYLSLSGSGGGDPLHDITKAWTEAQGSTAMSLTPGHSSSVVFGDDVTREDGTVALGWRPGDRVSFVDRWTRISEVVAGYRIEANDGRLTSAIPILGRQERGVYSALATRLRDAERRATKAQLAPPRRLPEQELIAAAAAEAAAVALIEEAARRAALEEEQAERIRMMEEQMEEQERLADETRAAYDLALRALEEAFRLNAVQPVSVTWTVEDGDLPSADWYLEMSYIVPEGEARSFDAEFIVTWGAASRGDWYEMSIDVNGREVGWTGSNSIGPLSPFGNGVVDMSVTASFTANPGDEIEFYLYSSAGSGSRYVNGGQIRLIGG